MLEDYLARLITAAAANQATLATLRPNPNVLRKALVSWVLSDHQAFRQVESATFRQFLAAIMPLQPNSLLPTRLTLRRWVLSTFDENKVTIAMHLAASKIAYLNFVQRMDSS